MAKKIDTRLTAIKKKLADNVGLTDDEEKYFLKQGLGVDDEDIDFIMEDLPEQNDPDSKVY